MKRLSIVIALASGAIVATPFPCRAQTPPPTMASPSPAPSSTPGPYYFSEVNDDKWHFGILPYVWLPSLNGTLKYPLPDNLGGGQNTIGVTVGPNQYLAKLNFALMGTALARHNDLTLGLDFIYLNVSSAGGHVTSFTGPLGHLNLTIGTASQTALKSTIATGVASFKVASSDSSQFALLVGVRNLSVTSSIAFQLTGPNGGERTASASRTVNLFDMVGGARGQFGISHSNWFVPYYIDWGAGQSQSTAQGVLGIGHAYKWGDVRLSWRQLYYNMGSDKLLESVNFGGPQLGALFRL
jgi:hypothetical protein